MHTPHAHARSHRPRSTRRGSAIIAVIIVLVVLQFIVLGIVVAGSRDQDMTAKRLAGVQAFYSAEGITNMAVREMYVAFDEDGDGTVGSVSNDGNGANNPTINGVGGIVVNSTSGTTTTLTTTVSGSTARRKIVVTLDN